MGCDLLSPHTGGYLSTRRRKTAIPQAQNLKMSLRGNFIRAILGWKDQLTKKQAVSS